MKLLRDASSFEYGKGTNPAGGGFVVVLPETPEEEKFLEDKGREREIAYLPSVKAWKISCRGVKHSPNPHDDGLHPVFTEMCRRFGVTTAEYGEIK